MTIFLYKFFSLSRRDVKAPRRTQIMCAMAPCKIESKCGCAIKFQPSTVLFLKGLSYYLLCFLFNKIREQEGGTGSAWKLGGGKVDQTMYTHVIKCKNGKIK
jgi:hypothetical protein